MHKKAMYDISVVIPIYNSATIFPVLYSQLCEVLEPLTKGNFEIITVIDGNKDNSLSVIESFQAKDNRIKIIEFARNFGHQAAVTAGLQVVSGNYVVIMDDDLEDPPAVVPLMLSKALEGYDVVYAIRKKRKVVWWKKMAYPLFYRFVNAVSEIELPYDTGDFCLMRAEVVEQINNLPEKNRYIRGLRSWVGFRQTGIEYERGKRLYGESGYSLKQYFRLAFDGILSFSYKPLHFITLIGFLFSIITFITGISFFIARFYGIGSNVPGWSSLMLAILFFGGVQLMAVGILGAYIARIYEEVKSRPQFVIKNTSGLFQKENYTE
jgi:glycosyltransferase involved in cell wall biosynthesis